MMLIKTAFVAAIATTMMLTSASLASDWQTPTGGDGLFHLATSKSKSKQAGQATFMSKKKRGTGGAMAKDEIKNCTYGNNHVTVCDLCSKDKDGDEVCIVDSVCYPQGSTVPRPC